MEIWELIVKSNTFNFVIFMLILIFVAKKVDISALLVSLQQKIIKLVEDSKLAVETSEDEVKKAENKLLKISNEVNSIIEDAEVTAEKLGKKILEDAKKQVEGIETNILKVIDSEIKKVNSNLSQKTAKVSLLVAKNHIKKTLDEKPQLHAKFINEGIEELDRLIF